MDRHHVPQRRVDGVELRRIALIGEGVSPRIVEEKLQAFLDPQVLANFTSPFTGRNEEAA